MAGQAAGYAAADAVQALPLVSTFWGEPLIPLVLDARKFQTVANAYESTSQQIYFWHVMS